MSPSYLYPLVHSAEEQPSLSGRVLNLASQSRIMESACLAAGISSQSSVTLPQRVLKMSTEARAPFTRHLYAHKLKVFESLSSLWNEDPVNCLILVVSFLWELLDVGHAPYILKVYIATMSAFHSRIDGRPVDRNDLVVKSLHGSRWLNPSHPTIPTLEALLCSPFHSSQLR